MSEPGVLNRHHALKIRSPFLSGLRRSVLALSGNNALTILRPVLNGSLVTPMPMFSVPTSPIVPFRSSMLRSMLPRHLVTSALAPQGGLCSRGPDADLSGLLVQFGGEKRHRGALEQTDDRQSLFQF